MLYLLVGFVFVKGFLKTNDVIYLIFGTAALLFFESELLFSFSKLWDPLWWYWHIIKVMISSGLLIGLVYGFTHTVYRLHESKIKLANFLREIEQKNFEIRDAYDRLKTTQKYLKESEKLASLGKMAAMVAHEIRNPLGAISNSLGALKRYSSLGRDDLELIGIVEKEMDRLNNMTEDFLSFARPSLLKMEATDVHPLIQETISLLRSDKLGWTKVRIEHSFAPDVPRLMLDREPIQTDPAQPADQRPAGYFGRRRSIHFNTVQAVRERSGDLNSRYRCRYVSGSRVAGLSTFFHDKRLGTGPGAQYRAQNREGTQRVRSSFQHPGEGNPCSA